MRGRGTINLREIPSGVFHRDDYESDSHVLHENSSRGINLHEGWNLLLAKVNTRDFHRAKSWTHVLFTSRTKQQGNHQVIQ